ncbi:MAG: HupE/UreJ family protein [Magnetococcus sp. THC-1_WYH]
MSPASTLLGVLLLVLASPAFAHTGVGQVGGLTAGFSHPIHGLDHILAMVAVGVLAAQQGGRSLWAIPGTFVAMMIFGGILGMTAASVPFVELGIAGSVVILGVVIALGGQMPMVAAMILVGSMAIFHGHAHGTEMPVNAVGITYGLGFAGVTAILHAAGIALTVGIKKTLETIAPMTIRIGGGAIAVVGATLFAT